MEQAVVEGLLNLCLIKEEEEEIPTTTRSKSELLEEGYLSLFTRLLSDRNQNQRALKNTLRSAWKMGLNLQIVDRKRDYGFLPELPANAKPHLDVGPDLDENSKPHKIKRLKIIPPKKPPNSYSVTSIWFSFDALVEVASLEVENFDKFARLIQEKALKKPIFIQEKVKSVAIQKRPRFGHDDDDQDWGLELETKKQRAMVVQEKRKRDYGFLPELPANAKPHLDVGPDLDENSKPHKIKRLKIIPPKKPPNSYSVTSIWLSFDALVEVASLEVENFDKFARLMQEKALKKPIFVQEKVKSVAIQKRPRFGHDDDDQDWGLELETKKQRAMVVQEKVMGSAFSIQD
nr:hypothetical protein CFP56_40414 [Quercus suber]